MVICISKYNCYLCNQKVNEYKNQIPKIKKTMKTLKTIIASIILATAFTACANQKAEQADELDQLSAIEFAQTLGLGWNLGNNLDAWGEDGIAVETAWKNKPATQEAFDAVAKAGFKSVRIPVTWIGHFGEAPEYKISEERMNRVAEVIGYAHNAGLKVIVNIHHDGHADGGKADTYTWLKIQEAAKSDSVNAAIKEQITAIWTQIANRFKDEGLWLIYETFNEIHDGNWGNKGVMENPEEQFRVLNEWNQTALDAIRATGGNNEKRYVGIPGYVTQPWLTTETMKLPTDKTEGRLMVAVHSYDPWDYAGSGKYSEWGHTSNVKDENGNLMYQEGEKDYVAMLDNLHNTYIKNGIPVYFGEFACVHRSNERAESFRKYYLEYVVKAMKDRQIVAFFWDNGYEHNRDNPDTDDDVFGLIDHTTGKYIWDGEEICKIMVNAWENNDSTYTLESIYEKAPAKE